MERLTLDEAIKHAKEVAKTNLAEATYNFPDLKEYYDNCSECANQHNQLAEWLEELKSYKEAEKQGLLVRFPCKIGEKLWCIVNSAIRELRVHHFDMPAFGTTDIVFRYADGFKLERFVGTLGETVFLTREEAEKKLEEMKNDANKMEKASIPVEVEKEIVTELEYIFRIVDDKPYFELKYKKVGEDYYQVGYSSFDFHNVLKWEKEYFELANCIECKSGQKNVVGRKCQACINKNMFEKI